MKKTQNTTENNYSQFPSSYFNIILEKEEEVMLTTLPKVKDLNNVIWSSRNEEIATVNQSGKVTAIGAGKTQVDMEKENEGFKDYINIKVVEKGEATDLRIAIKLQVGELVRLSLEETETALWESLSTNVATVNQNGEVTAQAQGISLIAATYNGETSLIYVIVGSSDNEEGINLAHISHFERIKQVIINNSGKVTETSTSTFGNLGTERSKWWGGVLADNGKIYGMPLHATTVLEIDPETRSTSTFGNTGTAISQWRSGVLADNRKIYGIPSNSTTVLEIDPNTKTITTFGNVGTASDKWWGGVLARNGKIYCVPCNSTTVLEIDPNTKTTTTFGNVGTATRKWMGGVLAPNGKIYCVPFNSSTILEIDPETRTTRTFGNVGTGRDKWLGGAISPNGKIYCIPFNSSTILEIDPEAKTTRTFGNVGTTAGKWVGGVLAPNGKIYGIPCISSTVLEIDPETRTTRTFGNVGTASPKWIGGVLAPNGKIYGIPDDAANVLEINLGDQLQNFDDTALISAWVNKL